MLGDEVLASLSDPLPRRRRAVDTDADARIQNALQIIKQMKGSICLDCLGVSQNDELRLVTEFASNKLPTHRIVEGFCTRCGKRQRIVRRVRAHP